MGHLITLQKNKIIAQDGFNRADNAASMSKADTGQAWVPTSGTWGISGNQAMIAITSGGIDRTVINIGASDFALSTNLATVKTNQRLLFRYTDLNNEWYLTITTTTYSINKRMTGTPTGMGTYSTTPVAGDRIKVVCKGNSINLFINGLLVLAVTDSFNSTATSVGLAGVNDVTVRFDDFLLEAL